MAGKTLTMTIPDELYTRIQAQAASTRRSIQEEALQVLALAVPPAETLPVDLHELLDHLTVLDDDALWRAARARLPRRAQARLTALNRAAQRDGLTEQEQVEQAALLQRSGNTTLVRAQAAFLLKQRGHDISSLIPPA